MPQLKYSHISSDPEGFFAAPVGSFAKNAATGQLWYKTTGTGTTGWVPMGNPSTISLPENAFSYVTQYGQTVQAIQAAVDAQSARGGGDVVVPYGTWAFDEALIGADNITIKAWGSRFTLDNLANDDIIRADGADSFVVDGPTLAGNKAGQTLDHLFDSDYTSKTRGIAILNCTRSGVRNTQIDDCLFHGVLVFEGIDNFVEETWVTDCGDLGSAQAYAIGVFVRNSPRFRGEGIVGIDNVNSQIGTSGGADGVGAKWDKIHAEGGASSPITINTTICTLSNFYAEITDLASSDSGAAGLTCGHTSGADVLADGLQVSNGTITGCRYGISLAACLGGSFTNVTCKDNSKHNLNIFGALVGGCSFHGCTFDGTSDTAVGSDGVGVVLTSVGATCPGQFDFFGCTVKNSAASGVVSAGIAGVRWFGGNIQDNVGVGIRIVDNTTLGSDHQLHGVTFQDTRAGGSRTQTQPITSLATGGRNTMIGFHSINHSSTDTPSMPGSSEQFFGTVTGDRWIFGGGGGLFDQLTVINRFQGPTTANAASPGFSFNGRTNQGLFSTGSASIAMAYAGVEGMRWSEGASEEAGFMTRVNRSGVFTLERVSLGAADSGGTGFKALRVPN